MKQIVNQKSHQQMLGAVRWLIVKAALLESVGLLFILAAILPLALMVFIKDQDSTIALALGFGAFFILVSALFKIIRGVLDAYSYGVKSEDFIRRFYAAMVETGDIRR